MDDPDLCLDVEESLLHKGSRGGEEMTIQLRTGAHMPVLGFGCAFYNWNSIDLDGAEKMVSAALRAGYRNLDTARSWDSERLVGNVLAQHVKTGLLMRKDVFISTKVCHPEDIWHPTYKRRPGLGFNWEDPHLDVPTKVAADIQASLTNLRIEYVDLLLMHWPGNYDSQASTNRVVRKKAWEAFENAHRLGHAKALGICNFAVHQLKDLMTDVSIKPAVAHIEGHPYCIDEEMVSFCKAHDIAVVAIAPFASGSFGLLEDQVLRELSSKYDRSVGQVILRWLHQRGLGALPKSMNCNRMASNLDIDFVIDTADIERINALNCNRRNRPDPRKIA